MAAAELKQAIRDRALELGFDIVRFTDSAPRHEIQAGLEAYLAAGHHGDMAWLASEPARRSDPRMLWPGVRSIIVLGMNYGPEDDPLAATRRPMEGAISVYAGGADYHDLIKRRLNELGGWLHRTSGAEIKVFVDTAAVMEKPLAQAAGAGWQGKHTNLVSREYGSWLFLGEIFTALDLPPDAAERDHCGTCRRCLDACPTDAFPHPYQLDARRCISYLTIEHKGQIPVEFRAAIGNRIYGCDDCLAVCPWNRFAQVARELAFKPREAARNASLETLAALDDATFRAWFRGSPIKRIGRDRFVRNVLVAIGNSASASLAAAAVALLRDPSPLVRGMAVWALARLDRSRLDQSFGRDAETDPEVLAEFDALSDQPVAHAVPLSVNPVGGALAVE